jgi:PAS domain S-box-containing protein
LITITGSFLMSDPETTRLIHQSLLGDAWENARQAVLVFDDANNFVAFNAAYCELTGYSREELLEPGALERLRAAGSPQAGAPDGSWRLRRKDGSVLDVRYRLIETHVSALPYTIALVSPES